MLHNPPEPLSSSPNMVITAFRTAVHKPKGPVKIYFQGRVHVDTNNSFGSLRNSVELCEQFIVKQLSSTVIFLAVMISLKKSCESQIKYAHAAY